MKKIVSLMLILFISLFASFAAPLERSVQPLIGYILKAVTFSVDIMNEVLPFDLKSEKVNPANGSASVLSGLKIGSYSLNANCDIKLYVAHTKLFLSGRIFGIGDSGTLSAIDYRLYLENKNGFDSCKSTNSYEYNLDSLDVSMLASENEKILIQETCSSPSDLISLENKGIYVRLEDSTTGAAPNQSTTALVVDALKAGTYSSDIVFFLEVQY